MNHQNVITYSRYYALRRKVLSKRPAGLEASALELDNWNNFKAI